MVCVYMSIYFLCTKLKALFFLSFRRIYHWLIITDWTAILPPISGCPYETLCHPQTECGMLTADWWRQKSIYRKRHKYIYKMSLDDAEVKWLSHVVLNSPLCGLPPRRIALDWRSWRRLWPRPGFPSGANHACKPPSFCPADPTQTQHTDFRKG